MRLAFTLCSINYLAQAKALGDSLLFHNSDYRFIIGLVDKNTTNVDLSAVKHEICEVDKVEIHDFQEMYTNYNIVELITAVKPFYFKYLFSKYSEVETIIYFDPDIIVYAPFEEMHQSFKNANIILTPHFTTPIEDAYHPTEKHVFNTGVFNLGFVAMKRSKDSENLINWWMKKLRYECILDLTRGYFVDQLWMNLAPAYFDNVLIDKHPGYNTAHWNLHERNILKKNNKYYVNDKPLVFYHFSHYNPKRPESIASYHDRFSFNSRPDIVPLFEEYKNTLIKNKYFELIGIKCYYINDERKKKIKKQLGGFLRQNVPLSWKMKINKFIKKG